MIIETKYSIGHKVTCKREDGIKVSGEVISVRITSSGISYEILLREKSPLDNDRYNVNEHDIIS